MSIRMQQRRGTAEQWTLANPTLAAGEIGFESDNNRFKMGDGVNQWADLDYFTSLDPEGPSLDDYVPLNVVGEPGGVASLDAQGQVPANQLGNATVDLSDYALTSEVTVAVNNAVSGLVGSAPGVLDTLNELAAAIGDDASFITTINNSIADAEADAIAAAALDATAKADAAELAAIAHANGLASNYDVAGAAATAEQNAKDYTDTEIAAIPAVDISGKQDKISGVSDTEIGYLDGVTSSIQTQLNAKLESSDLDGLATESFVTDAIAEIPTPDYTGLATETYVDTAVANLVDTAPAALDTLNELAAALGDDANFATTVSTSLGNKQDKVSGVSDTEIGYLDGVTSAIQTQINGKASTSHTHGLNDLSDVDTSGAVSGEVLSFNGTNWEASSPSLPTLTASASTPIYLYNETTFGANNGAIRHSYSGRYSEVSYTDETTPRITTNIRSIIEMRYCNLGFFVVMGRDASYNTVFAVSADGYNFKEFSLGYSAAYMIVGISEYNNQKFFVVHLGNAFDGNSISLKFSYSSLPYVSNNTIDGLTMTTVTNHPFIAPFIAGMLPDTNAPTGDRSMNTAVIGFEAGEGEGLNGVRGYLVTTYPTSQSIDCSALPGSYGGPVDSRLNAVSLPGRGIIFCYSSNGTMILARVTATFSGAVAQNITSNLPSTLGDGSARSSSELIIAGAGNGYLLIELKSNTTNYRQLYRSSDLGNTWTPLSTSLTGLWTQYKGFYGGYFWATVDNVNSDLPNLVRSLDGDSWENVRYTRRFFNYYQDGERPYFKEAAFGTPWQKSPATTPIAGYASPGGAYFPGHLDHSNSMFIA